jgi:hypothetical protein
MQDARDQCLIGHPFFVRPRLNVHEVSSGKTNVHPPVLGEGRTRSRTEYIQLRLRRAGGNQRALIVGAQDSLFVTIKLFHFGLPFQDSLAWPSGLE